jgi:acyl-CoA reductase-like NAD-dependent aldehyde dehydrogenase
MILTKSELLASLQKEVRILLHLAGKIDRSKLDYRPTPKQRSTLELLQYLSYMGPMLVRYAKGEAMDAETWGPVVQTAAARDFDQTLAAIDAHKETYAALVADMDDAAFRAEVAGFDGAKTTCGAFIVNHVLGQCAAYRTQLFLYLKASGREELSTMNLWVGVDPPAAV